ncbi:MAG: zf-HC2 domain-containing protein [Actinobacteria bacterium]|nr:zf-HC2 domain-containing protein [Actinomycetota bacterium]
MSWHADPAVLERYALGVIDEPTAYSVEAHLLACSSCRASLAGSFDAPRLNRVWEEVAWNLDAPKATLVERLLLRLGVPDHVARLLSATPSLRLSWFVAVAVALAFAVLAAHAGAGTSEGSGLLLFLLVAPLIPVAGVAAAYGPGIDPTYEIGLASPMRSHRLLLIRSLAVLVSSTALAGLAALSLPDLGWWAAAWLLPALGLTGASLALATFWSPLRASGVVTLAWISLIVLSEAKAGGSLVAFGTNGQLAFLIVLIAAALVLAGRLKTFDARSV